MYPGGSGSAGAVTGCARRVVAMLGPTGVGKTAVAVELARQLGTRIISCDSMQVYAGFSVLTNQPRGREATEARHELVGFVDPGCSFSAGEYALLARPLLKEELGTRGRALIVGGTGLYMRAALAPLAASPAVGPGLRVSLEERARREGVESLHTQLAGLDPDAAGSIDPRNARRVVRALEVVLGGGGRWSGRSDLWAPEYDYPTLVVGLVMDTEVLGQRILARAERMVADGAVEEVQRFREDRGRLEGRPGNAGICQAIGYEEVVRLLQGEQSRAETIRRITGATRRYAHRQLTWLRKVRDAVMIDVREREAGDVAWEILTLAAPESSEKEPSRR